MILPSLIKYPKYVKNVQIYNKHTNTFIFFLPQDWKTLAQMLTQTKDPEKRPVPRMSRFDCEAVTRDQARLAKKLLAPLTVDKVKVECDAVTACFVWVSNMTTGCSLTPLSHLDILRRRIKCCKESCLRWKPCTISFNQTPPIKCLFWSRNV